MWNVSLVALFSLSGLPTRTNVGEIAGAVVCLEDIKQCILLFKPNPEPVILHCLKLGDRENWEIEKTEKEKESNFIEVHRITYVGCDKIQS